MARGGINKFHVKQARDGLIAKGQHPSLDAIRTAMGNTGSKSTIHRYIRELEEEEGTQLDDHALLSSTLKDIIERLAKQLRADAQEIVERQEIVHQQQLKALQERLTGTENALTKCTADLQQCQSDLAQECTKHQATLSAFHNEQLRSHRLEQEVQGLKSQLGAAERHQTSLEEKHQHARDALEHFRNAAKEQREQESRRHEQQVQQLQAEMRQLQQTLIIKQSEITESAKDNARLATQLTESRKNQLSLERELKETTAAHGNEKERTILLERSHGDAQARGEAFAAELQCLQASMKEETEQRAEREKECLILRAKLEAQAMILDSFKAQLKAPLTDVGDAASQ
ncbi:Cointegrate resolution protein T [gamma proteobacterium HdN1]|nr:Cointegrate resolution protein T [gamma proteobacterium HdN1]